MKNVPAAHFEHEADAFEPEAVEKDPAPQNAQVSEDCAPEPV